MPVNVLFETLQKMFAAEANGANIKIRLLQSSAALCVPPLPLMRVLSNLVANALRHAQCRRLLLGVRRRGDRLQLEVHDDGAGLSAAELERMQQAGAKSGASAGEGLGLAIVRRLCAEHGFDFLPSSRQGVGSVMRVTVPRH